MKKVKEENKYGIELENLKHLNGMWHKGFSYKRMKFESNSSFACGSLCFSNWSNVEPDDIKAFFTFLKKYAGNAGENKKNRESLGKELKTHLPWDFGSIITVSGNSYIKNKAYKALLEAGFTVVDEHINYRHGKSYKQQILTLKF